MNIPALLPIERMEDCPTNYLGETQDGRLFWGYETFTFTKPFFQIRNEGWGKHRKEYAVLHTFDKEGNYLVTKYWSDVAGTGASNTELRLEEMVAALGLVKYKDIEIKLFQTEIDGIVFGLVADDKSGLINSQPGSLISFQEPWNGEYYT